MQIWDVRKCSGAPSFGATGPQRHAQVATVNVHRALSKVATLMQETAVPNSGLTHLQLNPLDPTHAAFALSCNWAGTAEALANGLHHDWTSHEQKIQEYHLPAVQKLSS